MARVAKKAPAKRGRPAKAAAKKVTAKKAPAKAAPSKAQVALDKLLTSKGFDLIAVESSGTNAFYVKKEYSHLFTILSPKLSWKPGGRFDDEISSAKIKENVSKSNFLEIK